MKPWTAEEKDYLESHWGVKSLPTIAKELGRSVNAIKIKAQKYGLGAFLESGDYVTLSQLFAAVTGSDKAYSYKMKSWVENRGLPVHTKRVDSCSFRVIKIEEFWEWAEKNRSFLDFSKMKPLILGKEPDWVDEQRKKDFKANALQRKDPWTPYEDDRLRHLLRLQKYGYAELSEMLNRTDGAIQRRCCDLGIKDRPVKADNHGTTAKWTDYMYAVVREGILHGDSYRVIANKVEKSEKAVRGKVYAIYGTENADKVRTILKGASA